ncbi:hypothetical protein F511_37239 [Dorcoceras hygrometricum]|uniref:Uncharacterized protein n=1 Tax=Dorcoceras hygrometricum TaxID=472368 RepID=A0A2Z7AXP8_9LAMI|nr:hypothetical protein F511_37239 [Dorcoceras hygrometricum]
MIVDSIGIYELKGPYYTLTMTDWFLQTLSVIPRGSWGDVARRYHGPMGRSENVFLIYNELDTASRGPTTIVAPESQFRTCPTNHDSIGYPRMSASGESSTTMHRLLHASGSHPIPTPYDPK